MNAASMLGLAVCKAVVCRRLLYNSLAGRRSCWFWVVHLVPCLDLQVFLCLGEIRNKKHPIFEKRIGLLDNVRAYAQPSA